MKSNNRPLHFGTVWRVARTQLSRWSRQRVTALVFFAVLVLQLAALADAFVQHQRISRMRATEQALVAQQWNEQPDRHPHRVAHYGYFARRIPSALSIVDQGVSRLVGHSVYLEAHHQNPSNFAEGLLSLQPQKVTWLDLGSILRILLPLFLIFIGYSVCSSEAEKGVSKVALGSGTSLQNLFYGKALAIFLVGFFLILPVLLTAALRLAFTPETAMPDTDLWLRLGGLALIYTSWTILLSAAITWISRQTKDAWSSLNLLLTAWVLLFLVAPRMVANLGASIQQLPSTAAFQAEVHKEVIAGGDSHNPNDPNYRALKERTLKQYGVETIEELPVNFGGLVMLEGEKNSTEIYAKHLKSLRQTIDAQNRPLAWLALLNPAIAMQQLSMSLAGTDHYHARDFEDQAEHYRYDLVQALNALHRDHIHYKDDRAQRLDIEMYRALPLFEYRFPNLNAIGSPLIWPALSLTLWTLFVLVAVSGTKQPKRIQSNMAKPLQRHMEASHELG